MQNNLAYLNGQWVPDESLVIPMNDLGFAMGATVVERLRTFNGKVFCLDEHLQRMSGSLEIIGVEAQGVIDTLRKVIPECAKRNFAQLAEGDDIGISVVVTPRAGSTGPATVSVCAMPLPFEQLATAYSDGVHVVVSDVRQVPGNCWPTQLKCRSRMHYYLAERAAQNSHTDTRAVLLDQDGFVGESTTANVVICNRDKGLVTPPRDRVLPGVTLQTTEELAATLNVPFAEELFTAEEMKLADEVMLVSTSICVLPVVQCDGKPIGNGSPGPIYRQLLEGWNKLTGIDIVEQARRRA